MNVRMTDKPVVAGYARVSTDSQSADPQITALKEYASRCGWTMHIYKDHAVSGLRDRRPALDAMLTDCRQRKVKKVIVWRIDRLGRSLTHLLSVCDDLRQLGVDLISLSETIDTSTPSGRLFYGQIALFANFERELLAERVRLGIAQARREGKQLGRKAQRTLTTAEEREVLRDRRKNRTSLRILARKHNVSAWQISKLLAQKASV